MYPYTGYNYVARNKNNACITILDSGNGGINQITMDGATNHN
jgi:hypothetical protein